MGNLTFDFDLEHGEEIATLTVEVDYRVVCDSDYGADADGNRGIASWFLDDMTFKILDYNGQDVTEKIKKEHPDAYALIEDQAEDNSMNAGMNEDECI